MLLAEQLKSLCFAGSVSGTQAITLCARALAEEVEDCGSTWGFTYKKSGVVKSVGILKD